MANKETADPKLEIFEVALVFGDSVRTMVLMARDEQTAILQAGQKADGRVDRVVVRPFRP